MADHYWSVLKSFLDESIEDSASLEKVRVLHQELAGTVKHLHDERADIEHEAPALKLSALGDAKEALQALDCANEKRENIAIALDRHLSSVRHQRLRNSLSTLSTKISEIQLAENYFGIVLQVGKIADNIKVALREDLEESKDASSAQEKNKRGLSDSDAGSEKEREATNTKEKAALYSNYRAAVDNFLQLRNIQHQLRHKRCANLKGFVTATVDKVAVFLQDYLKSKYVALFPKICWPAVPSLVTPLNAPIPDPKDLHAFRLLFSLILLLQVSQEETGYSDDAKEPEQNLEAKAEELVTLWPIQLLLEPLTKRFRFHFTGKKATNRLDKPEWFFMDTRDVIRLNTAFIEQHVQPLLDNEAISFHYRNHDAMAELVAGMIGAINEKLSREMNIMLQDDDLLCHTVNEVLEFHKAVCEPDLYPPHYPSCLNVFTQDKLVFRSWIDVEHKFALEHLAEILQENNKPWDLLYGHMHEEDEPSTGAAPHDEELRPSQSADALITLLSNVTDRYKHLYKVAERLQFFEEIQSKLLLQYHRKIRERFDADYSNIMQHRFHLAAMLLNSMTYTRSILNDWGDQLFFLELQTERVRRKKAKENADKSDIDSDDAMLDVSGSVFDDVLAHYTQLKTEITQTVVHSVLSAFKDNTHYYFNTRKIWGNKHDFIGDDTPLDISSDFCEALAVLKRDLAALRTELSARLFEKMWRKIASHINNYIFTEMKSGILHFVDQGGMQFKRDMVALFLIFREFTPKPDNLFKEVKEIVIILTLSAGQLSELRSLVGDHYQPSDGDRLDWKDKLRFSLKQEAAAKKKQEQDVDEKEPFAKFGIYKLDTKQVQTILSLRIQ